MRTKKVKANYIFIVTVFVCFFISKKAFATCNPPYDFDETLNSFNVVSCATVSDKIQVKKLVGASRIDFEAYKYTSDIYIVGPRQEDLYIRTVIIEASCESATRVKFVQRTHEEQCYYDGQ